MLGIVAALHAEAKPLVEHFKLKKDMSFHGLNLFSNDWLELVVSGVGKTKSAIATTRLLSRGKARAVVNIGICGSLREDDIGECFLIHHLKDNGTGRVWIPDCLVRTGLQEASLITVDRPADISSGPALVDMEATGFFEAANHFISPSRIALMKVVSDRNDGRAFSHDEVSSLIAQREPEISAVLSALRALVSREAAPESPDREDGVNQIATRLRLSFREREILLHEARRYRLCLGQLPDLSALVNTASIGGPSAPAWRALVEYLRKACRQTPAPCPSPSSSSSPFKHGEPP